MRSLCRLQHRSEQLRQPVAGGVVPALRAAKARILSTLGVALAAYEMAPVRIVRRLAQPVAAGPQSAILGLHAINDRPVAVNGQVVIRPMMYLALSYDHRLIDGKEAVTFLVKVKQAIEDPARLLLAI